MCETEGRKGEVVWLVGWLVVCLKAASYGNINVSAAVCGIYTAALIYYCVMFPLFPAFIWSNYMSQTMLLFILMSVS